MILHLHFIPANRTVNFAALNQIERGGEVLSINHEPEMKLMDLEEGQYKKMEIDKTMGMISLGKIAAMTVISSEYALFPQFVKFFLTLYR